MRSADAATLVRILLIFVVVYLTIIRFNPIAIILLFALALILDGVDGYLAVRESSKGKIGPMMYLKSSLGNPKMRKAVQEARAKTSQYAVYGPRLDIAGDRIAEYSLWALFTYLHIVPLFVLLIVITRHSIVDAFMGIRGTSSKMKSRAARMLYSSNVSRAAANILKFVTFSYLVLEYVWKYPAIYGNVLVAALVLFIVVRGIAEVLEDLS